MPDDSLRGMLAAIMSSSAPLPNFQRAEFANEAPRPDACPYCHREIGAEYYRVDGNLACPPCAEQAQSLIPPDSHKAYSHALIFGIGAAIVGCIGYAIFTIVTGITLGFAAIVVGLMVGKAMMKGSNGLGGKRYQITAAILTYAAVAVAFVPIALHELGEHKKAGATQTQASAADPAPHAEAKAAAEKTIGFGGFIGAILLLLGLGLISPFLTLAASFFHGVIGLLILFFGIQTACNATKRVASEVDGPYEASRSS